jgi:exopolysaccharide biosynthesis polyprenyl glycosylphosphotransferase
MTSVSIDTIDARPSTGAMHESASAAHHDLRPVARPLSLRFETIALIVVDAIAALLAVLCGLDARFGGSTAAIAGVPYPAIAAGFPAVWVMTMALGGTYDRRFLAVGLEEYWRVMNATVWLGGTIAVASYMLELHISRGFVAITMPLSVVLTLTGRYVHRKGLHSVLAQGAAFHRVVIIGSGNSAERLEQHMSRAAFAGYAVVGVYEGFCETDADEGLPLDLQSPLAVEALVDAVYRLGADTIALASGGFGSLGVQRLSWRLEGTGITLLVAPDVADIAGPRILVRPVAGLPLLHIEEPEFQGAQRVLKEVMDRVGAGLLLLLLSPLMGVIALIALVSQGRPILYRQERVGRYGLPFDIHKFRTMRNGADRELSNLAHLNIHSGELFKIREDPRVTRLGRLLRRFSLDELPQLWDVLRGWMSLVGPRPPLPQETTGYREDARRRLLVKPGITGLWQVSGRSDLSWEETVRLDLHYVENWSVALDITLLCRTLMAVFSSRGAY